MPDTSLEARIGRLEERFAGFIETMAEFKGALSADMKESQRQRSGLFRMVEQVSHQLVEISTKFDAHVEAEEVLRIEIVTRVTRVEERVTAIDLKANELEERSGQPCVAHMCAPAPQPPPEQPTPPAPATVKPWWAALGGGGLLAVLFGDNVAETIGNIVKAVRNALH